VRSSTPADLAGRCHRCFLRVAHCICPSIPRVETRSTVLVLRHAKEVWRSSNTGRLAALALPRLSLVTYGSLEQRADFESLVPTDAWLLFPDGPPLQSPPEPGAPLVVVDGSWKQARSLVHRVPALRRLRRISLAATPGIRRIRRPTVEQGMSTLEAIARALEEIEGPEVGRPLSALHEELVRRVWRQRGRAQLC
jgi:DTW domain-containing protein